MSRHDTKAALELGKSAPSMNRSCRGEQLMVNDFDVSEALYRMQLSLKKYKWKLSLEDHLHVILASASRLLLPPHKYPDELKPFIQYDGWLATVQLIQSRYKINQLPMPVNTVADMLAAIDKLLTGARNRKDVVKAIDSLSLSVHESMFAEVLRSLIRKLPPLPIEENVNESELCSRFVDPFLSGLLDDPDAGVYLRCTNEMTLEAKKHGDRAAKQAEYRHVLWCDLLKVAAFCKDALGKQNFDSILGIQIVGRTITFYVLLLPSMRLYTMLRLAEIKLPESLQDLPSLVMELPSITGVLEVFDDLYVPTKDMQRAIDRQAPTASIPLFQQFHSSSKNRKRSCHLKLRDN
ncbi:hypothetical protein DFQ29_010133 [Apophysomyces sp. BC1021]|nr:hypothetical protein DFQ29_010133 [Apophysomyces sp. BC1021]